MPHDHHFVLPDPITDSPLSRVRYTITAPDGTIIRGMTDGAGKTQIVPTGYAPGALLLRLDLEAPSSSKLLGKVQKGKS